MKNDGTDWDALVAKRLAEVHRDRQDEAQAAQPPPGPEAAVKVIDRIRAAAGTEPGTDPGESNETGASAGPQSPPASGRSPREHEPIPTARPPLDQTHREHRHHHFSWHRARRTIFLLVLLALFIAGLCLTFSPQLKQIVGFLRPTRETAEDGLIAPTEPGAAGDKEKPKPPADLPDAVKAGPQEATPKASPPAGEPGTAAPEPTPTEHKPEPDPAIKREPFIKTDPPDKGPEKNSESKPEQKPVVPLEPAKPVDPSAMPPPPIPPSPPEPPKIPAMPTGPWNTQGQGGGRPVEPQDSVG